MTNTNDIIKNTDYGTPVYMLESELETFVSELYDGMRPDMELYQFEDQFIAGCHDLDTDEDWHEICEAYEQGWMTPELKAFFENEI